MASAIMPDWRKEMQWRIAAKLALVLVPPLVVALRDGRLQREELAALVELAAAALLRDSKP